MKTLMPVGTKVKILVGDNTGKTGKVYNVHPEDFQEYDVMVDDTQEVWIYGGEEIEPLAS